MTGAQVCTYNLMRPVKLTNVRETRIASGGSLNVLQGGGQVKLIDAIVVLNS